MEDIPVISSSLNPKTGYAIVIGISDYPGSSYDLSYCDDDAQGVYSMLINDYNFEPSNIIYLQDSAANKDAISDAFDFIATQADSNDIFFFYYSGHGGTDTTTTQYSTSISSPHPYPNYYDHYWSIYNPDAISMRVHFSRLETESGYDYVFVGDSDLQSGYYYYYYTGNYPSGRWSGWVPVLSDKRIWINLYTDYSITAWGFNIDYYEVERSDGTHYLYPYDAISNPSQQYFDYLLDSKLDSIACAEKYVICDSCFSGGMIPESQSSGRYMMMACLDDEMSLEDPTFHHGVFSYYFLRSLDYASDSDGDGVISMEECYDYSYSYTVSRSSSLGYTHHPQEYDGIAGASVLYPSLGSISFVPSSNQLGYSFNLYGNGEIQNISLVIANVNISNFTFQVSDLSLNSPTETGFGYYEGLISLNGVTSINNYGIIVQIQGNRLITLENIQTTDFDNDSIDDITEILYGLDPRTSDTDSDGLDDILEFYGITDPLNNDTDGDLMLDGYEYYNNLNNTMNDAADDYDNDGLTNLEEFQIGTSANNNDTDNDGLLDGLEINIYPTDVFDPDTDDDGLLDGLEILILGSNATNGDSDGDAMPDLYEYNNGLNLMGNDASTDLDGDGLLNLLECQLGSMANNPDTDGDIMPDLYEYNNGLNLTSNDANADFDGDGLNNLVEYYLGSNINCTDSDGDTMPDFYEYNNGLDLIGDDTIFDYDGDGLVNLLECQLGSFANSIDTDGDTISDLYEYNNGLNLFIDDSNSDHDWDGVSNILEYIIGASSINADSDNDGLSDGFEYNTYFTDLLNPDTDQDGLNDYIEVMNYNTDPLLWDTDGDGCSDGMEIAWGLNPLNSKSSIKTRILNALGITILILTIIFVTQNMLLKAKQKTQINKKFEGLFQINKNSGNYNGLKVEIKVKPKPVQYNYQDYRPQNNYKNYQPQSRPSYTIPIYNTFRAPSIKKACRWCGHMNYIFNERCIQCGGLLI